MKTRGWIARSVVAAAAFAASMMAAFAAPPPKEKPLWRNIDECHFVQGPEMTAIDLDSMVVLVSVFNTNTLKDAPFGFIEEQARYMKDTRFRALFSVKGPKLSEAKIEKIAKKLKMKIGDRCTIFNDAGITTNEPQVVSFPFLYVVDQKGQVAYSGDSTADALAAVKKALASLPAEDPILGIARPEKIMSVTNFLHEGENLRFAYDHLKKKFGDKDPDVVREAHKLISAMDQKLDMRMDEILDGVKDEPGMSSWKLEVVENMWPQAKSDERVAEFLKERGKIEEADKIAKIVVQCEKLALSEVKKKADAKRLAAIFETNVKKLERLAKSKSRTVKSESEIYVARARQLAEKFKTWEPPAPPAPVEPPPAAPAAGEKK